MGWMWFSIGVIVGYIMAALMTAASREDRMNEAREARAYREAEKGTERVSEQAVARGEGTAYLSDLPEER